MLCMSLTMVACMHSSGLRYYQVKAIEKKGFEYQLEDENWLLKVPDHVLFQSGSDKVAEQFKPEITSLAKYLQRYNLEQLKVVGHTDNVGASDYNMQLSKNRAKSVTQLFVNAGYQPEWIEMIGRGETRPLVENDSDENRAKNRRVEIIIVP